MCSKNLNLKIYSRKGVPEVIFIHNHLLQKYFCHFIEIVDMVQKEFAKEAYIQRYDCSRLDQRPKTNKNLDFLLNS